MGSRRLADLGLERKMYGIWCVARGGQGVAPAMNVLDYCTVRKRRGSEYEWWTVLYLGHHGAHNGTITANNRADALAQVRAHVERILARKASYEEVHDRHV
jgi:hypothetical protein